MNTMIQNDLLTVDYDRDRAAFSVSERASGREFLRSGRLEGAGEYAMVCPCQDEIFGKGNRIAIPHEAGGSLYSLELYEGLPFLLVRGSLRNRDAVRKDIKSIVPIRFLVDLNEPAAGLKTLGTGGLLGPEENPGSYVFLACALPATRRGVVAGWVTHARGSGIVFSSVTGDAVEFSGQIDYGQLHLAPGELVTLETFAVGVFDDARLGLEKFADLTARQYRVKLPPREAVYCTWYAEDHGEAGDEQSTLEIGEFISKELQSRGLTTIQIDDRWQDGPMLDGPARGFDRARPGGPYPNGIAPVASALREMGLTLGLWWLPFGRNHQDPDWQDRQDWFARWADGNLMRTASFGGTCLDLTHPAVREHLAHISRLYREWGVRYFKMDGLWTGTATEIAYINDGYKDDNMSNVASFYDPKKTQIEAYREGLKIIRKHAGDDVFFSGCAVSQNMRSFGASFGLVDAMRIGPDFNHDKLGVKTGPIRASRLYFLNGRVWWNDPDPAKVRASSSESTADPGATGAVSVDLARMTASFSALTGQLLLLSDWLPNLPAERLDILKRTMPSFDGEVRPVDYFDHFLPSIWLLTKEVSGESIWVLGLFNWEKTSQKIASSLAHAGLDPLQTYHAFDFWDNVLLPDIQRAFAYELPPESCKVVAIRAAKDRPLLLGTSQHVTQGMMEAHGETWDGEALSGQCELIKGDEYELRIRVPVDWIYDNAVCDLPFEVTPSEGLLRVKFGALVTATGPVMWGVSFRRQTRSLRSQVKPS